MKYPCTEERFLNEIKEHKMEIIRDDGIHRHIRFKSPGTICYYFDIITWPGNLCITGDCGTYTFQRVTDMFKFFRMREYDIANNPKKKLNINTGYWAEKVTSIDRHGKIEEFSSELFEENVKQHFNDFCEDDPEEDRNALWSEITSDVLSCTDDEREAYTAVNTFECDGFEFEDFDYNCKEYTFRYIWNLYAIVYGIKEYDKHKSVNYTDPETVG